MIPDLRSLWSLLVFVILLCIDNVIFCYLSYIIGSIFTLHYMSIHSVLALENVFDVAKIHRDCSPDSLRAIGNIILLSQSSIPNPFFPLATVILGSPTETDEDIDIGYQAAEALCREGDEKGRREIGQQKESREWRGKWWKKGDHRSARTIDKRPG